MSCGRYSSLKAGVLGLTRQMAVDFGPLGVRVNAICPGLIVKESFEQTLREDPEHKACTYHMQQQLPLLCLRPEASQKLLPVLENQYPGRAYGEPLDIANGVRFLCSSEAKFITGHTLSIDGGLTIQLQEDLGMRQADFKEEQLASRGPKL